MTNLSTTLANHKLIVRMAIVMSGLCGLFIVFYVLAHVPLTANFWDNARSWLENTRPLVRGTILAFFSAVMMGMCVVLIWAEMKNRGKRGLQWLYWVVPLFMVLALLDLLENLFFRTHRDSVMMAKYPKSFGVALRIDVFFVIMGLAVLIYIFRRRRPIAFGLSEMVVGLVTNLDVINGIDFSQLPHLRLTSTEIFKIAAFTYLLCQGINDAFEGLTRREGQPDRTMTTRPA